MVYQTTHQIVVWWIGIIVQYSRCVMFVTWPSYALNYIYVHVLELVLESPHQKCSWWYINVNTSSLMFTGSRALIRRDRANDERRESLINKDYATSCWNVHYPLNRRGVPYLHGAMSQAFSSDLLVLACLFYQECHLMTIFVYL